MKGRNRNSRPAESPRNRALTSAAGAGLPAWAAGAVLALLIGIVYGPAANTPFIVDDFPAIIQNESITSLWPLFGVAKPGPLNPPAELPVSGRPVVNLAFALNYHFSGLEPFGYHIVNLVIHFLSALLLWAIVRRTLRLPYFDGRFNHVAEWLALSVATLWALHPLLTESVIYITQRTEIMMGMFYLATLYCSMRYRATSAHEATERDQQRRTAQYSSRARYAWLSAAVIACLCGMGSKEVMVSAPLIVLLFDRTFISGSLAGALRKSWPLYAGLAATWLPLVYLNLQTPHRDAAGFAFGVTGLEWWFTQSRVLFMYLKLAVWPHPLLIHYQLPYLSTFAEAWVYVVPLVLLALGTLYLLWRNRPLGFLGTWFFAILSPTFAIPIVSEIAAERRMYMALIIPVAIFVIGGYQLLTTGPLRRSANTANDVVGGSPMMWIGVPTLILTLVYCFMDVSRLAAYDNELGLWLSVRELQPQNMRSWLYIGWYFEKTGNDDAAIQQYEGYLKQGLPCRDPSEAQMHFRLGQLLLKKGQSQEAIPHLAEAVRVVPDKAMLRNNLAYALFVAGKNAEAANEYRTAIKLDPNFWPAHKNLGEALLSAGEYRDAIKSFESALRLKPGEIEIYNSLATCHSHLNEREQAITALNHGLELARSANDAENVKRFTAALESLQK
jgi:tetratricopeptide (TPR) repeat protein